MNNKLEIEIDGKKEKYDILLKVNLKNENGSYILYTKHELNDIGDTIVYAGILEENGKEVVIKPVCDEEKLEMLEDLLMQIEKRTNKKEVEKK